MPSPGALHALKNIGGNAAAGAAAFGYAGHRAKKKGLETGDENLKKVRVGPQAAMGAVLGAAWGTRAAISKPYIRDPAAFRQAKEVLKQQGHKFRDIHELAGTAGGAALGGGLAYRAAKKNQKKGKKADPRAAAVTGAFFGGSLGNIVGSNARFAHFRRVAGKFQAPGGPSPISTKVPSWVKGAKTKTDAKKAYHAQAMKYHPDKGGAHANQAKMQEINKEWDDFEKSPHFSKLSSVDVAFLEGLFSEIQDIWSC